jgi:predicted nucleotide-binding protein
MRPHDVVVDALDVAGQCRSLGEHLFVRSQQMMLLFSYVIEDVTDKEDEMDENGDKKKRRSPLRQVDVPGQRLKEALRVPEALRDHFAGQSARPLQVASAINMQPNSGPFRMLTGASEAYGLTAGASRSEEIALTELGRAIVRPREEGADLRGMREAIQQPRVIREFLKRYDGQRLPRQDIAANVIADDLGVPPDAADDAFLMIVANGEDVGVIVENKGHKYVDLQAPIGIGDGSFALPTSDPEALASGNGREASGEDDPAPSPAEALTEPPAALATPVPPNRRIFISHGKDTKVVAQLKTILAFGDFEPIVAKEKDTIAVPVPDKVIGAMRECGGAIIHVSPERKLIDAEGNEVAQVNLNVLIEIGAAMALYDRKFVLLVEHGTELPSNLQGLYEVRYTGGELDHESTMRLLATLSEFKK